MIKLQNLDEKLEQIDVFIDDPRSFTNDPTYFNVVDFPEVVPIGRTRFFMNGSEFLKRGSELKIELKNSEGGVIFTEPVDAFISTGEFRPVSIVVYDDDIGGQATLTILAELENYINENGAIVPIPEQWRGLYNLRWQQNVLIDRTTTVNTNPIHFVRQPQIEASEVISPYVTISGSIQENTITQTDKAVRIKSDGVIESRVYMEDGNPVFTTFNSNMIGGIVRIPAHSTSGSDGLGAQFYGLETDFTASITNVISNTKLQTNFGPLPWTQSEQSNITYPFYEMISNLPGGEIPTAQAIKYNSDGTTQTGNFNYNTVISNPPPPYFPDTGSYFSYLADSTIGGYEIEYVSASFIETQRKISYAKLFITDMKTYSGDVDKIKIFVTPQNQSEEINLGELKVQDQNIFVKELGANNSFFQDRLGDFLSQDFIDTNYTASLVEHSGDVFAENLINTQPTLSFVETPLMNGLKVSGSVGGLVDFYKVEYKGTPISFKADNEYKLRLKLHGKKLSETNVELNPFTFESINKAKINIYMSGSAFSTNHQVEDFGAEDTDVSLVTDNIRGRIDGKRVYANLIDDEFTEREYPHIEANFKADFDGSGVPTFIIESGEWTIADVRIEISHEDGFSPDNYLAFIPIDKSIDDDVLTFRVEFENPNNEPSTIEALSAPTDFAGGNEVLGGDSNLLAGDMYISNTVGSGVQMGGTNSGFIRSVGYQGFDSASAGKGSGFMIYSGSVLPESPDNYSGVGLELHAGGTSGSLKFRSDTQELDIRTDKFFVGRENQQFISGSDGNIRISSSKFHLDTSTDTFVVGVGTTIEADLSADSIFTPAGTDIDTALAAITADGFAKFESASIAGWEITSSKIEKNNVALNSDIGGLVVTDTDENLKIKVASGSLSETTGSGVNLITNAGFEDTTVGRSEPELVGLWSVVSSSTGTANSYPLANFEGDVSASIFVTSSNPAVGSKHIRIFIPAEIDTPGGGIG